MVAWMEAIAARSAIHRVAVYTLAPAVGALAVVLACAAFFAGAALLYYVPWLWVPLCASVLGASVWVLYSIWPMLMIVALVVGGVLLLIYAPLMFIGLALVIIIVVLAR